MILEPIQGEAGVVVPPDGYLAAARRITGEAGALLILDEVQTGIGRTGWWLAHHAPQHEGLRPDIITLAKGLGGGLPIGAMIRLDHPGVPALTPGSHGSTFGGNPISAAAALAVLDTIVGEGLLANATQRGEQIRAALASVEGVVEVRGAGLLLGVVLDEPVAQGGRGSGARGRRPGQRGRTRRDPAGPGPEPHRRGGRPWRRGAAPAIGAARSSEHAP